MIALDVGAGASFVGLPYLFSGPCATAGAASSRVSGTIRLGRILTPSVGELDS